MSKYNKVVKGQVESPMKFLPLALAPHALIAKHFGKAAVEGYKEGGLKGAIKGAFDATPIGMMAPGTEGAEAAIKPAEAQLEASRQAFMDYEFKNPFENITNPYLTTENVYEDITVDQRAAQAARSQLDAQTEQLLQAQRETGEFNISNIQAIADIQKQGREAIARDISRQEQQGEQLRLGEAARLQQQRLGTDLAIQQMAAAGAQAQQKLEFGRLGTQFGIDMERLSGAQQGLALAKQGRAQFFGDLLGTALTAGAGL